MPLYLFRCPTCGAECEQRSPDSPPVCTGHALPDMTADLPLMRRVYAVAIGKVGGAGGSPARTS